MPESQLLTAGSAGVKDFSRPHGMPAIVEKTECEAAANAVTSAVMGQILA
jgi:hypothetical protein